MMLAGVERVLGASVGTTSNGGEVIGVDLLEIRDEHVLVPFVERDTLLCSARAITSTPRYRVDR